MMRMIVTLLALLGLAACGALPRPFAGNPGGEAQHLAEPPPVRLIVPVPRNIFLPEGPSADLARVLAENLLDAEVPAAIGVPKRGDWRLVIEADHRGTDVVPTYRVIDPAGEQRGITEGLPIPTELWVSNPPLRRISGEATPRVVSLLSRIEAARRQSDPNSLQNRAPRLLVTEVTGAPGDGNITLARLVKVELVKAGQELQDEAKGADFTLAAEVSGLPVAERLRVTFTRLVEWHVTLRCPRCQLAFKTLGKLLAGFCRLRSGLGGRFGFPQQQLALQELQAQARHLIG